MLSTVLSLAFSYMTREYRLRLILLTTLKKATQRSASTYTMDVSCSICRSLSHVRFSCYITTVRETGERGCRFCQTIVSGIDLIERIEEVESLPAPMSRPHSLVTRHDKGSTLFIEIKDQAFRRVYELEIYALAGELQTSNSKA